MQPAVLFFIRHGKAIPERAGDGIGLQCAHRSPYRHEAIRVFVLQRTHQDMIDDGKHRGRGADSQRDSQYSDDCELRPPAERLKGITAVGCDGIESATEAAEVHWLRVLRLRQFLTVRSTVCSSAGTSS